MLRQMRSGLLIVSVEPQDEPTVSFRYNLRCHRNDVRGFRHPDQANTIVKSLSHAGEICRAFVLLLNGFLSRRNIRPIQIFILAVSW